MQISLTMQERMLLTNGFKAMSLQEKNQLVSVIAGKEGKPYFEITEDYVLDYHKRLKIDILSEECDGAIVKGFTSSNGHHYRTNRDDQINMVAKNIQLLHDVTISEVKWKTEDAGYITHPRAEWLKVYSEGITHKETNLYKYNTLKIQISNATEEADILAVDWHLEPTE